MRGTSQSLIFVPVVHSLEEHPLRTSIGGPLCVRKLHDPIEGFHSYLWILSRQCQVVVLQ